MLVIWLIASVSMRFLSTLLIPSWGVMSPTMAAAHDRDSQPPQRMLTQHWTQEHTFSKVMHHRQL